MASGSGVFTLIWCTLCLLIGFGVTGFTIYKFDHPSLQLIQRQQYQAVFTTIRITTVVSLILYCISLLCYVIAAFDWILRDSDSQVYYDARIGMFICYLLAYLCMFLVLVERLRQMTVYINLEYAAFVYVVLTALILLGVVAFSAFFFLYAAKDSAARASSNRALALFFAFSGLALHLSLSALIIALFVRRLYQHIASQQEILIVSMSTDACRDGHSFDIMLSLIKRYTVVSSVSIASTFCMLIPVLVYFARADEARLREQDERGFFAHFAWCLMGLEMVINTVCILLYLPLSIRLYHRVCCGMEALCDEYVVAGFKERILQRMRIGSSSEFSSVTRNTDLEDSERSQTSVIRTK